MEYDFSRPTDRHGTDSYKWDSTPEADIIPLWVADMDFETFPCITEALQRRVAHGIFGYTHVPEAYYEAVCNWFGKRHGWHINREDIIYTSGVVPAVSAVIKALTLPGDQVIVQGPVYNCFFSCIKNSGCEVEENELKRVGNCTYEIDFEDFERKCADEKTKAFLLCNPHNPGGIVWKKETLVRLADICAKHNILVISDEIHAEMAYPQYTHYPFASVSDTAASCSVTFMAPSKTFNIAGIVTSYAIVPNDRIREEFYSFLEAGEFGDGTIFAYTATTAAYTYGAEWLQQMRMYIMENVRFVEEFMKQHLPKIKVYQPQASFLVWLDCRELKLSQDELVHLFKDKAGLALNDGSIFGPGGEGHMRLNIGCPRSVLDKAMNALKKAVDKK